MQTVNSDGGALSAAYTTACGASFRNVISQVLVKWDGNNWTDETLNLAETGHSGIYQLNPPGSADLLAAGDVGQATITFRNYKWRYSAHSTRGDGSLRVPVLTTDRRLRGIEVKINQGFYTGGTPAAPTDLEYVQIFHGVIYDWDEDAARKTFTIYLRDMGQKYLQQRTNTTVQENQRIDEWIDTMADAAGISAGDRDLDVSVYTIRHCWASDESPISEIWIATQADGGRVYFDHHAVLRFENAMHWLDHSASVWTLTEDDFDNLLPVPVTDNLASEVQAEWSPRREVSLTEVYKLDEIKIIRPGETLPFDVLFSRPVVTLFDLRPEDDYQIINAAGGNMNADCTVEIPTATRYAQRATVSITNNHGYQSAMLIYFQLRGTSLIGNASQELTIPVDPSPVDFTITRWLRGNMNIQSDSHARALATFLAENTCARIRPDWQIVGLRGVPQIEIGDRLTFSDDRTASAERDGFVTRIAWSDNVTGGFKQDLTLVDADSLLPYDDYFIIGTDTLGEHERCYY